MRLPQLAIANYQFTLIVVVLLLIMGITSFLTMPRTEDPPISAPGASILIVYPGASPIDMEELICTPVEEAINELSDIKKFRSSMRDNLAGFSVEFEEHTDASEKYNEVVQKINSIKPSLPSDIAYIETREFTIADVSILQLAFVSENAEYYEMKNRADELKKDLERIKGVMKVSLHAVPEREIRIEPDFARMAKMNISLEQLAGAIQSSNANVPGGEVEIGKRVFNIKTGSTYENLNEIENIVVSFINGKLVLLKDVATVSFRYEDYKYKAKFNGVRSIFLTVTQKENTNIFDIADKLRDIVEKHQKLLPENIKIETVFDQSLSVSQRINGFLSNLLQGILVVGILVLLSIGTRAAIIVIIAIPFSILIGLGFVDLSGFGLQQISIAGLVISLGLLVDNAIVITENVARFINMGFGKKEAAIKGTQQIAWPIVSSTFTTLLAFIPIIMMREKAGDFIRSMPITVVYTLSASLLLALTLSPLLASMVLKRRIPTKKRKEHRPIVRFANGPYRRLLVKSLRKKTLILISAFVIFLGSLSVIPLVGVSFFPKAEKNQFMIDIVTPDGSSLAYTDSITSTVEKMLDTLPEVRFYASNIGHGNPKIYYNIFPRSFYKTYSQVFVELERYQEPHFSELMDKLREMYTNRPEARYQIREFDQGPPIEAPIVVRVTGNNLDVLKQIAAKIEDNMQDIPGVMNIDNQMAGERTDVHFDINKKKAAAYGVPVVEISRTIRAAFAGFEVSKYRDPDGKEYKMIIRMPIADKAQLLDYETIYVKSLSGRFIPLKQLVELKFKSVPSEITHFMAERSATITCDVSKAFTVDAVQKQMQEMMKHIQMPEGYSYKFGGEIESREETFGGMAQAAIIAIIAIFAVLVLQFRSFGQPLIIYCSIPLAIVGSIWTLYITGYTFSFTALIGLTSLIGIVINNAIILVDYSNKLRAEEGKTIEEAVVEAGVTRFLPIMLTSFTTIGGLLPLTLQGGALWAPMGWTIIGGLLVSTVLTLIVVPVLYLIFTPKNNELNLT